MCMGTQNGCSLATFLRPKYISKFQKKTWRWWQAMVVHPIPIPCALALPSPSHRDAATPSPCWASHFMTQKRLMFSNSTPSELRLSPAATMSDYMQSALTSALPFILQPAIPPQVVTFESQTISAPICLSRFTFAESRKSNLWTCACVLPFPLLSLLFWWKWIFNFKSLFANWLLSPQRFNYYFSLIIVCWQYQKYSTILVLVLCLLCVTLLVCSSYSSFAPRSIFFNSWWQQDCEWFTHILVLLIDVAFITS